jgi:hypothetical protein
MLSFSQANTFLWVVLGIKFGPCPGMTRNKLISFQLSYVRSPNFSKWEEEHARTPVLNSLHYAKRRIVPYLYTFFTHTHVNSIYIAEVESRL